MRAAKQILKDISNRCDDRVLFAFLFAGMHEDGQDIMGEGSMADKAKLMTLLLAKLVHLLRGDGFQEEEIQQVLDSVAEQAYEASLEAFQ